MSSRRLLDLSGRGVSRAYGYARNVNRVTTRSDFEKSLLESDYLVMASVRQASLLLDCMSRTGRWFLHALSNILNIASDFRPTPILH